MATNRWLVPGNLPPKTFQRRRRMKNPVRVIHLKNSTFVAKGDKEGGGGRWATGEGEGGRETRDAGFYAWRHGCVDAWMRQAGRSPVCKQILDNIESDEEED